VSHQLESRHYFMARDVVRHVNGADGEVLEGGALYARIRWLDGREEEVDQFDPAIAVIERAGAGV
jgi:hypothetical protein